VLDEYVRCLCSTLSYTSPKRMNPALLYRCQPGTVKNARDMEMAAEVLCFI
jgi:hypothetical protein